MEEDAPIIGALLEPLREAGHEILTLRSKKAVLDSPDLVRTADVIVLDLIIPEGQGVEPQERYAGLSVLRHIREELNLDTPVVVLSVVRADQPLEEARDLGVSAILFKPTLPSEVKKVVEQALSVSSS